MSLCHCRVKFLFDYLFQLVQIKQIFARCSVFKTQQSIELQRWRFKRWRWKDKRCLYWYWPWHNLQVWLIDQRFTVCDLFWFYSCVAVWKNGRPEICPNEQGNRVTPSYVAWTSDGQRLVGDAAKNQAATNPTNTVFDIKRLIGRKYSDPSVQRDSKLLPFKSKRLIDCVSFNNLNSQLQVENLTSPSFVWRAEETPRFCLPRKSAPW